MTTLTLALARFSAGDTTVPDDVRAGAAWAVAAVAAGAAAGADDPAAVALAQVAGGFGTPPEAGVPGRTERYGASWAALLTATAATLAAGGEGYARAGEGYARAGEGYARAVVPAGLAVGAARGLSLGAVAGAVAIGLEVAHRLDAALAGALNDFDPVATIGHLAATATAGHLLGLSPPAVAHAYGISATQAAGLTATATGPIGALQTGKAAADAVQAASLARDGYTAGVTGIEGRRGLAALMAPGAVLDGVATGLGRTWTYAEAAGARPADLGEPAPDDEEPIPDHGEPTPDYIASFTPTHRS